MVAGVYFQVVDRGVSPSRSPRTFWLVRDGWDDYHFRTMFHLVYRGEDGELHTLGTVKIGQVGMVEYSRTELESSFNTLDATYFSVGQDRDYYESVMALGQSLGQQVLTALNDIAISEERFAVAETQQVTLSSLFRFVNATVVVQQFRRIAAGGVVLTPYDFSYTYPLAESGTAPTLAFKVKPESMPPSNVHVLIGSNGSGKTTLLTNMARTLVDGDDSGASGQFEPSAGAESPFANIVTVSFSAFDPFAAIQSTRALKYSYVGLKAGRAGKTVKTVADLADDFVAGLDSCARGSRRDRWLDAMATLNADPLLDDSGIRDLLADGSPSIDVEVATETFDRLSSGHKIVVLTMTRLVQLVDEKTLALLDEPEAHLHPPLLSAFTRALSDLLEDRNGVAVIATHSPVVLQEVPESCVWAIRRTGSVVTSERLEIETFGEGVGTLTARVFGLEVTGTGYHQLLQKALQETAGSYDSGLGYFDGHVGGEGRAILRSLARRNGN